MWVLSLLLLTATGAPAKSPLVLSSGQAEAGVRPPAEPSHAVRNVHTADAGTDTRWPAETVTFRRISSADGLPHNTVHAVLQDHQGFLWIGTADGLARYDGYEFEVYRSVPGDTSSLTHNTVRSLYEDDGGILWIGTERGVDRLDRQSGRINSYRRLMRDRSAVWDFARDSAGRLWIGSPSELVALDQRHRPTHRISAPSRDSVLVAFGNLDVDPKGTVWVGHWKAPADGTVFRIRVGTEANLGEVQLQSAPLEAVVSDPRLAPASFVHVGPSGVIWLGSDQGVFRLDPATDAIERVPALPPSNVLFEDSSGRLWAAGPSGLFLHNTATGRSTRLTLDRTGTNALRRNVRVIYEDRSGIIWIGTLAGLYSHVPHAPSFGRLQHDPRTAASLSSNVVSAVLEEPEAVWIGTLGGGLNRVDRWTGDITRVRIEHSTESAQAGRADDRVSDDARRSPVDSSPDDGSPRDNVWAIHRDGTGNLWIGTDAGLCRLEARTGGCSTLDLGMDQPYVNDLTEDRSGSIWIGGDGLVRLDPRTGRIDSVQLRDRHFGDAPNAVHNIQALRFDRDGVLWVGTEFSGLFRYEPDTGRQYHYAYAEDGAGSLRGRSVRAILTDPTQPNVRWLGTEMGLVALDVSAGTFETTWPRRPDESASAYAILPDEAGRLWVSTSRGLLRLDRQRSRIMTYDESAGTGSTEFNRRAAFRGEDGMLYFGGMQGLTVFRPEAVRDRPQNSPVVITKIAVANRDTTREIRPYGLDRIILGPRDKTLTVKYAALGFAETTQTTYAYRLDGFDERWIPSGLRRSVTYTNLPAGRYTFRVRVSTGPGSPTETAALALLVRPPFTQAWWFRLLVIVGVAGLLLSLHRFRVAQLLRVERMRTRIAGDLHDEIGSKLSSIALRTEMVARESALSDKQRRQLQEITQTSRRMVNELRDIVWMVNPRFDSFEDLVSKVDHTASSMLGERTYDLEVADIARSKSIPPDARRHLYLMCREMLHNVVRHAGASHVDIKMVGTKSGLELTVSDDGLGFDPEKRFSGNGLHMLRTRAEAIGGTLDVWSRPGEGTRLTIHVKMA